MYISKLNLINFKSFEDIKLEFCNKHNYIVGFNGVGKTNILDAIHCLAMCKSNFNLMYSDIINYDKLFFSIKSNVILENNLVDEYLFSYDKKNQKKIIKKNGKIYKKVSEHIGNIPLVFLSPRDIDIVNDYSSIRRRLLDMSISQFNISYMSYIINYNKLLYLRNLYLKNNFKSNKPKESYFDYYNYKIIDLAPKIYEFRKKFIYNLKPILISYYNEISNSDEDIDIIYKSSLNDMDMKSILDKNMDKDSTLKYTSEGIHRDDIIFKFNNRSLKKVASQGQQKSFVTALKLSQYDVIRNNMDNNPILILDDIFDKLDNKRVYNLINLINGNDFNQVFISHTNAEQLKNLIKCNGNDNKFINLDNI